MYFTIQMEQRTYPSIRVSTPRSGPAVGVIAIVGSAGGIAALIELIRPLPSGFGIPILVAMHLARGRSSLDAVLSRHSLLTIGWATEPEQPVGGNVYLVPPGKQLAIGARGFTLSDLGVGARSWLASGDHLINSAVQLYGARTIGIVLSGALPAGVNGMRAVKACGGITMAQNQKSASNFDMPCAAIDFGKADFVMSPARMASALRVVGDQWCAEPDARA